MAQTVYILCALTSLACAILLWRAYRSTRVPLLLWSSFCFAVLTLSNVVLAVDLTILSHIDLQPVRSGMTLIGLTALLYGLIIREK